MSKMSQKIVIPKGLINPNETTIIEIPEDIQNIETIIAKPLYEKVDSNEFQDQYESGDYYEEYEYDDESNTEVTDDVIFVEDLEYCETGLEVEESDYVPYANHKKYRKRKSPLTYVHPIYSNLSANPFIESSKCLVPTNTKYWKNVRQEREYVNSVCQNGACRKSHVSSKDLMSILDAMDRSEFYKLQQNLKEYQLARRRLIYDTTQIHTLEDVNAAIAMLK